MKIVLRLCLVFTFIFVVGNLEIFPCTCKYPPNLTEKEKIEGNFKSADFVFTGKVIKVFQKQVREGKHIWLEGENIVVLEIIGDFKNNIKKKRITIKTGIGGGDCGFPFEKGKKYLVYAVFTKIRDSNNSYLKPELHNKNCSRTTLLSQANSDIEIINQIVATK